MLAQKLAPKLLLKLYRIEGVFYIGVWFKELPMVRLLTLFVFTLLLFSTLNAQPYETIFSERQDGAENYASFDPLLDESNQFAGFIYCDTARKQVIVDEFKVDSLVAIDLDGTPVKTVHFFSQERDVLYIYVLLNSDNQTPEIGLLTITDEGVSKTIVSADCFTAPGNLSGIVRQNILLYRENARTVSGVWFEVTLEYEDYDATLNGSSEVVSTSILYSQDLRDELLRNDVAGVRSGNLSGDETDEFVAFKNYSYHYNFDDLNFEPVEGEVRWTSYSVQKSDSRNIAWQTTDNGHTHGVFVGDFESSLDYDEFIYHGNAFDLTDDHTDRVEHLACYNFADETARELWYLEIEGVEFEHVYADKKVLVGRQGPDQLVFVDYRRGEMGDTIELDRELSNMAFFETYDDPSALNLVGRAHDTVFVYRFEISTAIESFSDSEEEEEEEIPQTFTLHQNHPNPFNGETRLSFDNEQSQYLTLKVYNILGQEVSTLMEGVYSTGIYYAYWSGKDDQGISQSSGVYFAKLNSGTESQIIKLIYLK